MEEGGAGGYFEVCSIKSSATGVFDSYQVTRLDVKQKGRAAMYSFAHESVTGAGWTRVLQQRQVRPLYGSGGVMKVKTRFMMHVFVGLAFARAHQSALRLKTVNNTLSPLKQAESIWFPAM